MWDLAGGDGQLWALAETALYRIDPHMPAPVGQRIGLKAHIGQGMHSNHVVASARSVWVSSFPDSSDDASGRITRLDPGHDATHVVTSILFPGAGSLALADGGLWVERFDGTGELDRLDAITGALTGPFQVVPDDVTRIVVRGGDLWILSYRSSGNVRTVTKVTLTPAVR